jgi:hypothetical protein
VTRKRLKLAVGDVFRMPVDEQHVGYGRIVHRWGDSGGHYYFAIFAGVDPADSEPDLDDIVKRPVTLLALSLDALLWHGVWQVVGRRDVVPAAISWPAYKEGVSPQGSYEIVDYTGELRRQATEGEAEELPVPVHRRADPCATGLPGAQRGWRVGRRLRRPAPAVLARVDLRAAVLAVGALRLALLPLPPAPVHQHHCALEQLGRARRVGEHVDVLLGRHSRDQH